MHQLGSRRHWLSEALRRLPAGCAAVTAVALVGALAGRHPAPALAQKSQLPRHPNIVFVLIDDMGYGDLSCYGNTQAATPNIDKIAGEGIRFTQFSVASPLCSPSRTALLTGRYPARYGITSYIDSRAINEKRGMKQWLDPHAPTIARSLQAAGYATGHFGKWHMGGGRDVGDAPLIAEYGFDTSLTQFEGLGDRILPILDARDGETPVKMPLGVSSEKLGHGNVTWIDRAHVTTAFVDRSIQFIKEAEKAGKPFYIDVWPDDVHSPFFPSAAGRGDGSKHARFEGVVHETDTQLAPLFELIRADPNLRDNTVVIIASDNGPEPGAGSPGPFRGRKGNLYEGGIREPLIVWGPGIVKRPGVNNATVVTGVDLRPSLMTIARVAPGLADGGTDGEDMSPELVGRAPTGLRTKPIFWIRPPDRPYPDGHPENIWPDLAVRDGDWKLVLGEDGSRQKLYNLAANVSEDDKYDVASTHAEIVARLTKLALDWRKTLPIGPLPTGPISGAPAAGTTSE